MHKLYAILLALLYFHYTTAQDFPVIDNNFGVNGRSAIPMFVSQAGSFFGSRQLLTYPNGDIFLASTTLWDVPNDDRDLFTARLSANGNLVGTYGDTGTLRIHTGARIEYINGSHMGADEKVVLAGVHRDLFQSIDRALLVRINPNGTLDTSFGGAGYVISDLSPISSISEGKDVKVLPDGKILLAARVRIASGNPAFEHAIVRYKQNGTIDSTFGSNGVLFITNPTTPEIAENLLVQADGKIVLLGTTTVSGMVKLHLARATSEGIPDSTFGTNGTTVITLSPSANFSVQDFYLQPDQKMIVAGAVSGAATLIRINTNGTIDNNFGSSGVCTIPASRMSNAFKILPAPNNKLYAIGKEFDSVKVARLSDAGILDQTFGEGGVAGVTNANPFGVDLNGAVLSNGSLLICGKWTNNNVDYISTIKVNITTNTTAIDPLVQNNTRIYPNPASRSIEMLSQWPISSLEVYDFSGKLAGHTRGINLLDISHLPNGLYLVRWVAVTGATGHTKLLVAH
ncbi:MAG: T9SS type A sorting domain-containing protein [Chitinophagales bacterium]|nr:T9SS type A sorting domain-containing protein [Chitinophagales bacterium]